MATERISAKRYGVRYGRKLREKVGKIEQVRRETNVCPYCKYEQQLKRLSAGIFHCLKCNTKFTGRAYYVGRKLEGVEKAAQKEAALATAAVIEEAPVEEEEEFDKQAEA